MTENIVGEYWHTHHDQLFEYCWSYEERAEYINTRKPPEERELRLALFRAIPAELLPPELIEAGKAKDEAGKAYSVAWKAYAEAREVYAGAWKPYVKAGKALDEARKAYSETVNAYTEAEKALAEAFQNHLPEIEALHRTHCHPRCPWDGKTIFAKGVSIDVLQE